MSDRLVASALVHALHPDRGMEAAAVALVRQAGNHPEALDRALAHLLHRVSQRPTVVTERAAAELRLARALLVAGVPTAAGGRSGSAGGPRSVTDGGG